MKLETWLIVMATLSGPVLAVQAQKWIERIRERRLQKRMLFDTLMATRAARLAPEHVRALNSIDLVYYGRRRLGRTKREQAVLDAWREYHDHLSTPYSQEGFPVWVARGAELFTNLLFAMAQELGMKFDRVQLTKGAYTPVAHGQLEDDQHLIRKFLLELLSGARQLRVDAGNGESSSRIEEAGQANKVPPAASNSPKI